MKLPEDVTPAARRPDEDVHRKALQAPTPREGRSAMRGSPFLVFAVLGLLVAGCLGAPEPIEQPVEPTSPPSETPPPSVPVTPAPTPVPTDREVASFPGKIMVGVGDNRLGYFEPTGAADSHLFTFAVGRGATAIVAELQWGDPADDLDLQIGAPDCDPTMNRQTCLFAEDGAPGAGDSPVKLVLQEDPLLTSTGDWRLMVWAKKAINRDFIAAVTVFYGDLPSETYSHLANTDEE
jgi:hypothetical protein